MIRNLFIIAVAALVLSIACFMGAAAIGGSEFRRNGWSISGDAWSLAGSGFHRESGDSYEADDIERRLDWSGGDSLEFHLPARVDYVQGDAVSVTVSGPADYVERVSFEDGRFDFDRNNLSPIRGGRVRISITAPAVTSFVMHGSHKLEIRNYDQDTLTVRLRGSGGVEAEGRARAVDVVLDGSGRVDLEDFETVDASLTLNGSGSIRAEATGAVDATVNGSGDIRLANRPAQINSRISGSGNIHEND